MNLRYTFILFKKPLVNKVNMGNLRRHIRKVGVVLGVNAVGYYHIANAFCRFHCRHGDGYGNIVKIHYKFL